MPVRLALVSLVDVKSVLFSLAFVGLAPLKSALLRLAFIEDSAKFAFVNCIAKIRANQICTNKICPSKIRTSEV